MAVFPLLLIRADADSSLGTGHVMRCLAIAQTWMARGHRARLMYRFCPQPLLQRLAAEGIELYCLQRDDEAELRQQSAGPGSEVLLVDGYHFSSSYRSLLQKVFSHTVALDDYATELPLHAECVINPQPQVREGYYDAPVSARILQGIDYLPLRREFGRSERGLPPLEERRRVLLVLGGTDPVRLTLPLSHLLLEQLPDEVMVDVVTGTQHPDVAALSELEARSSGRLRLLHGVTDMALLMEQSGMAVTAAGSTVWELAAMRVPAVVVMVAENQRVVANYPYWPAVLDAIGGEAAHIAVEAAQKAALLWSDVALRQRFVESMQSLSLGQGSDNICDCLESLITKVKGSGRS